jgi:hypothetical protein
MPRHTSPAAARTPTLATRTAKDHTTDVDHLRSEWAARTVTAGLDVEPVIRPPRAIAVGDVTAELAGPDRLTAQGTAFDRRLVLLALASTYPDGSPVHRFRIDTDWFLARPDIVALAGSTPIGGTRYSTAHLLVVEAWLVDGAARRAGAGVGTVPGAVVDRVITERPSLSEDQVTMVRRLAGSGAGVEVVVGRAGTGTGTGTGKTFALDAARAAWTGRGRSSRVGTALAAKAAAGLQNGTGIPPAPSPSCWWSARRGGGGGGRRGRDGRDPQARPAPPPRSPGRGQSRPRRRPPPAPEIDAGGALAALARRLGPVELTPTGGRSSGGNARPLTSSATAPSEPRSPPTTGPGGSPWPAPPILPARPSSTTGSRPAGQTGPVSPASLRPPCTHHPGRRRLLESGPGSISAAARPDRRRRGHRRSELCGGRRGPRATQRPTAGDPQRHHRPPHPPGRTGHDREGHRRGLLRVFLQDTTSFTPVTHPKVDPVSYTTGRDTILFMQRFEGAGFG